MIKSSVNFLESSTPNCFKKLIVSSLTYTAAKVIPPKKSPFPTSSHPMYSLKLISLYIFTLQKL